MLTLLLKLIVYGHLGFLIEIWFTGIHAVIFEKDKKATAITYLPMFLVYGFTALALEGISEALLWPFYLKALVYVPIIYGVEFLSGWTIKKLIGTIPWDYKKGPWTPMGLINFSYLPFWFLLALGFDAIVSVVRRITLFVITQI